MTASRVRRRSAVGSDVDRARLRAFAAVLAGATALLYGLIALHVVTVLDGPVTEVAGAQLAFAAPASGVYVIGVVLLLRYDDRRLWAIGLTLQLLVIGMYLSVASDRQPAYELWGVTIRVFQIGLLAILGRLALRPGADS